MLTEQMVGAGKQGERLAAKGMAVAFKVQSIL